MNVTLIDWIIVAGFFVIFLAMAIYLNAQCRTVADYLVSGRKVRMWLGMGAGLAGEVGLVSIAAMCEQGYLHGFSFVLLAILSMAVLTPLFGYFGFGIERFRATKAMSVPQYIEMRYSRRLRILTGIFNSAAGVFQMCVFPIVGAGFLRVLMRAPEHVDFAGVPIQTTWIIMAALLACNVLFTYLGGYLTLVVTNFFHMILTLGALYTLLILVVQKTGLQTTWTSLENAKGLAGFYPFAQEGYGPIWFFWMMTMSILLQFSYGPYLQKYAAMDKPRTASRAYLLGTLFGNGRTFAIMGLGVVALAVLGTSPPVELGVTVETWKSMATPYYLSQVTPPILMGFLLMGLISADTSTTDQYLLSWSTSIVNDCICPFLRTPLTVKQHLKAVRITIVVLCVLFFGFGLIYTPTLPLWEYLWLCANIIGGTGVAVLFGMYWRRATTAGAYAAVFTCLLLPVVDLIGRRVFVVWRPGQQYPIAPEMTGLYSYLLAMFLLIVISLCSNKATKFQDLGAIANEMNRGETRA